MGFGALVAGEVDAAPLRRTANGSTRVDPAVEVTGLLDARDCAVVLPTRVDGALLRDSGWKLRLASSSASLEGRTGLEVVRWPIGDNDLPIGHDVRPCIEGRLLSARGRTRRCCRAASEDGTARHRDAQTDADHRRPLRLPSRAVK